MMDIWILLLLVAFGFSVLTHAFFWYESNGGPHREYLDRLSRGHAVWWTCRGMLWGAGSILLVALLFPLGFVRALRRFESSGEDSLPPVILVHGLYHNASGWALYRWCLPRSGFSRIYALSYPSFGATFWDHLARLDDLVREVAARSPGRTPVLIGHSLGGLLCRAFADAPGNAGRVRAVVTLGAPHRGSKLAALSFGGLGQSLRFEGPLVKELERRRSPPGSRRLALYSPMDTMVLPCDALRIDDPAWEQLEVKPVGHVGMLFHPPTARKVMEYLREVAR
jgi:pimeloyl-ACP methyl ester carboxylesterase